MDIAETERGKQVAPTVSFEDNCLVATCSILSLQDRVIVGTPGTS